MNDPKRTDLGSYKQNWLESELNGHIVDSSILKEIKIALKIPNNSDHVFTLSNYKESENTANNVYPRSFTVNYSLSINGQSESGVLKGVIKPKHTFDEATGKTRNMMNRFSFQFEKIEKLN